MNTGAIAVRYAKALMLFAEENGRLEQVAGQVKAILAEPDHLPSPLEPCLGKFVELLALRGRADSTLCIFRKFIDLYYRETGIRRASLTVAQDIPGLEDKIRTLLEKQTGCRVDLDKVVDPSLVGGFVIEVEGFMMDASVRHQIETIRRQFITSNNILE